MSPPKHHRDNPSNAVNGGSMLDANHGVNLARRLTVGFGEQLHEDAMPVPAAPYGQAAASAAGYHLNRKLKLPVHNRKSYTL